MFLITYDNYENRAWVDGNAVLDGKTLPAQALPYPFRLYDDDGGLMLSGVSSDRDGPEAFEPLDFAEERYGCTEIWYQQPSGEWEQL